MNPSRSHVHLENLKLDLRGLPRETAEAVPSYLAGSLQAALAGMTPGKSEPAKSPAALRVKLHPGATPSSVADAIAAAIARSLCSSGEERERPTSP